MRHLDYRTSKALDDERLAQARKLRRPSQEKDDRFRQRFQVKDHFGRWLIAFGRRLVSDEADAI